MDALEPRRLLTFGEVETLFGGGDGIAPVTTPFTGESAGVVLPLDDGRYYALGGRYGGVATGTDLFIRRYNATGSLDTSFGVAGQTLLPIPGNQGSLAAVLDANGSIVIATSDFNDTSTLQTAVVARVLSNGLFDTSFAGVGYRTLNLGGYNDTMAIAMSGSNIVIGGRANMNNALGTADFAFARLLPNGTLDSTFSGDGIAVVDLGGGEYFTSMAVQPDGKIIGVGYSRYSGGVDFRMVAHRINANGTSDTAFGTGGGWREFNFPGNYEVANACAIWNDRLYIVGDIDQTPGSSASRGMVIAMNLSTGTTDSSFNTLAFPTATNGNGYLSFQFDTGTNPRTTLGAVRVENDSRILVAGAFSPANTTQQNLGLASIGPDGSFDTSLDGDGRVVRMQLGEVFQGQVRDMALTADHSVLVVDGENVLRLRGMLDLSYGAGGTASVNLAGLRMKVVSSVITADNKTVVAMRPMDLSGVTNPDYFSIIVARFTSDGLLDTFFGGGSSLGSGFSVIHFPPIAAGATLSLSSAADLALQSDGKIIVVAGVTELAAGLPPVILASRIGVTRLQTNGTLDPSFGSSGLSRISTQNSAMSFYTASARVDSNDRITIAATEGSSSSDRHPFLARLTAGGFFDTSFNATGVALPALALPVTFGAANLTVSDVALRPNGNIVYVGSYNPVTSIIGTQEPAQFFVAEQNANGTVNTSFGINGVGTGGTAAKVDVLTSIAIQPDGSIVAGGYTGDINTASAIVIRTQPNGYYDPSFGSGGIATGPAVNALAGFTPGERNTQILLQSDGKIVASTIVSQIVSTYDGESALWRLNGNGSVDTTFQPYDGFGEVDRRINVAVSTIAQQADGKIVFAGVGKPLGARLYRTTGGAFQVVSARYMIDGYNGIATYPTVRIKFTSAVDLATVQASDFTVGYTLYLIYTPIPAAHLAWQTTGDPTEVDLYYIGPDGPAALVWPKGVLSVSVNSGAIAPVGGASMPASATFTFKIMPGDADGNGAVNFDDLLKLSQNYGTGGRLHSQGDFNYDGVVNFDDLLILSQNYAQSLVVLPAPGPVTKKRPRP